LPSRAPALVRGGRSGAAGGSPVRPLRHRRAVEPGARRDGTVPGAHGAGARERRAGDDRPRYRRAASRLVARAGFTAIHAGRTRFGRDGRWYCDGEPIANQAIGRLYARTMTVGADGRARLELGEDRAEVEIDDTPWVVTGVEGDPRRGFTVVLNDDTREPLDLASLRLSSESVPYCRVKGGRVEARLL